MARLVQFLVFAGLASLIAAQTLIWKGGNTNWDVTSNWASGLSPKVSSSVCSTQFGDDSVNLVSRLSSSTYNVGGSLQLPKDGKLILSTDGTIIKFKSQTATCDDSNTAKFVAGLSYTQSNDFFCHKNWQRSNGANVTNPPCNQDVNFPNTNTYKVYLSPDVRAVPLFSIAYNGITVSTVEDVYSKLGPQFWGITNQYAPGKLLMSSDARNAYCEEFSDTSTPCICFTTCPDAKDSIYGSSVIVQNYNKTITKAFTGTFAPAALGLDAASLTNLINTNSTLQNIYTEFSNGLASVWGATDIIAALTLNTQTNMLTLVGSLSAAGSYFTIPPDNIIDRNETVFTLNTWNQIENNSTTVKTLRYTLAQAMYSTLLSTQNTASNEVESADSTKKAFDALNELLGAFSNPLDAFNAAFPAVQATNLANCAANTNCAASLLSTLQNNPNLNLAAGFDANKLSDVAAALATAASGLSTNPTLLNSLTTALSAAQSANGQQTVITNNRKQFTLAAPSFIIGSKRTSDELTALLESDNLQNLQNFFYGLTKNQPRFYLDEMIKSSIRFAPVNNAPTRRRAGTVTAVELNFNYTATCAQLNGCGIPTQSEDPTKYQSVKEELDTLMTFVQPGDKQTTAPSTTTTTEAPGPGGAEASSSGGGGAGLAIGAAAGGVVILVLIIVALIIYSRRKRRPNTVARADDRTVVAFENPMYDDPTHGSAPVYDSTNHANDHEGLYDEPAFQQQQKKDNPLYQSTEALDQAVYDSAEGAQADGYLDVSAQDGGVQDTGYLDQAPPVEDTGYLDQAPH